MDLDSNGKTYNQLPIIKQENCIKFGELISNDGKLTFLCNFCQEIFFKSILFIGHVKNHVPIEIQSIKEAFLANTSDLDTLKNHQLNKLYIKNDLTNFDSKNPNYPELHKLDNPCSNSLDKSNASLKPTIEDEIIQLNPSSSSNLIEQNIKIEPLRRRVTKGNCKTKEKENKKKRIRLLNGKVNWQCPLCNIVLKCTSKYDHLKRHSGQSSFKCKHCNEKFSTKVRRRNHEKIHTGEIERPIKCPDCPKYFKSKVILKNHIKRDHLGIREHKCDYCEKKFYLKVEKISHERSNHTKEKPCICEICGLSFRVQQKLNTHMQNHDEPKFQCDKCNKKFYAKANLKRHQICHSNLKPFSCEICSANFPRLGAYKTHLKLHSDIKEYICKFCGKDYYDISGISCHMKSAHKIQYNKINVIKRSEKEND